jgi:TatD DNase family protein
MLIDAHSHVDRYGLVHEHALQSALAEIAQHRILTISNSMDLPSYRRNLEISEECDLVLPVFGVHPWNAPEYANRLQDLSEAVEATMQDVRPRARMASAVATSLPRSS